jgi:hypothetical protein
MRIPVLLARASKDQAQAQHVLLMKADAPDDL